MPCEYMQVCTHEDSTTTTQWLPVKPHRQIGGLVDYMSPMHAPDFEFESAMASQMLERYDLTGRSATSQVIPGTSLSPARMVRSGDGAMAVVPRSLLKRTHTNSDMYCM